MHLTPNFVSFHVLFWAIRTLFTSVPLPNWWNSCFRMLPAVLALGAEPDVKQVVGFFTVALYVVFWPVRIRGCVRRWRQPLLRGPQWFFNVHVQPDFYAGPGRKILRRYWMRIFPG